MLVHLIAIALEWLSLLVPEAGERERWRARWAGSLDGYVRWLESRSLPAGEVRRYLGRYLRDGAAEALAARWPMAELREQWRRRLRSPGVALVIPFTLVAAGVWWSQGASLLRAAFRPLAPAAGSRLVTAVPERSFFGKTRGFTARQFQLISARSQTYQALAGYAIRLQDVAIVPAPGGGILIRPSRVALVTPGFLASLGFAEGEAYAAEQLGSEWIGRTIGTGNGHTYRIRGLWPRDFRPALARPDFWIPESPGSLETTMVAVLKPGITSEAAGRELRDILLSAPPRRGTGTPTAVVPLVHAQAGALGSLWIGFLVLIVALVGFVAWQLAMADGRCPWRMELFFLAKAIPLITGIFFCSVAGFGVPSSGTAGGPFLVFWLTGIGAALAIWWARRDQHMRCPQCLARMTLSVQIGTHGATLLEGVGDEVLCEYGHGALWLPGAAAQAFGPEVWRSE